MYSCIGLVLSSACFFGAMGVSLGDITRGKAIARLVLWCIGLTCDFTGLMLSSSTSRAIYYQLEYWTERHAAVVLIVLGEGGELWPNLQGHRALTFDTDPDWVSWYSVQSLDSSKTSEVSIQVQQQASERPS